MNFTWHFVVTVIRVCTTTTMYSTCTATYTNIHIFGNNMFHAVHVWRVYISRLPTTEMFGFLVSVICHGFSNFPVRCCPFLSDSVMLPLAPLTRTMRPVYLHIYPIRCCRSYVQLCCGKYISWHLINIQLPNPMRIMRQRLLHEAYLWL